VPACFVTRITAAQIVFDYFHHVEQGFDSTTEGLMITNHDPDGQASVQSYDPDVFDRLNLFRTAKTLLSRHKGSISDLGGVIIDHKLHNVFGVSLLHKHFDLHHDEVLVRNIDSARRIAHSGPVSRHVEAVPYLWKALRDPGGRLRLAPLEFVRRHDVLSYEVDLTRHASFLTAIARALAERNLLDVFGISTTNIRNIPLGPHELMVETTDSEKRRLTITPMPRADVKIDDLTETFWTFIPGPVVDIGEVLKCTGEHCRQHCQSHCHTHCISHCSGLNHCYGHCVEHGPVCTVHCNHPDPY
jgi:hypothetical protein